MGRTPPRWRRCSARSRKGRLDGLVHCLAFAGKEEPIGDYSATTAAGFARALEISATLAPLCAHAKPLFSEKAGVITLSYLVPSGPSPTTT